MAAPHPTTVVFDLGNVLLGWDPRVLYRKLFAEEHAMEVFLRDVCTHDWNLEQDRGRSFAEGVAELTARHPEALHALIRAYDERWVEMLTGEIAGTVALLERLHAAGTPLYALTNWNQDKFAHARERYLCLQRFRGIVVSGDERLVKPDPAIYTCLLDRYGLSARDCVFIDDSPKNVAGAQVVGMHGLHFRDPEQLARDLSSLGFAV
ncbi:MAG: HAD family phosphatase [Polyangiales bacterium]